MMNASLTFRRSLLIFIVSFLCSGAIFFSSIQNVQAQNFIVSNLDVSGNTSTVEGSHENWRAASFMTGSIPYSIDRAVTPLRWDTLFEFQTDESHFVAIYDNSDENEPGNELGKVLYPVETAPSTGLYWLLPPNRWSESSHHEGANGERIDLQARTTYWMVFGDTAVGGGDFTVGTIDSTEETGDPNLIDLGGAWKIGNSHLHSTNQGGTWQMQDHALRFGITADSISITTGNLEPAGTLLNVVIQSGVWRAGSFRTDDSASLFRLENLLMSSTETWGTTGNEDQFISIYLDSAGVPGTHLGNFSDFENLGTQRFRFTPEGEIRLEPDTTYWLVFGERGDSNFFIAGTDSTDEDGPWSIGNGHLQSTDSGMSWPHPSTDTLQFEITATIIPEPSALFAGIFLGIFVLMVRFRKLFSRS